MNKKEMLRENVQFVLEELWTKYYEMEKIDDGDIDPGTQLKYDNLVDQIADIIYECGERNRNPEVKSIVESQYDAHNDMTYIIQKILIDNRVKSCVIIGWYFGEPDEKITKEYIGNGYEKY